MFFSNQETFGSDLLDEPTFAQRQLPKMATANLLHDPRFVAVCTSNNSVAHEYPLRFAEMWHGMGIGFLIFLSMNVPAAITNTDVPLSIIDKSASTEFRQKKEEEDQ